MLPLNKSGQFVALAVTAFVCISSRPSQGQVSVEKAQDSFRELERSLKYIPGARSNPYRVRELNVNGKRMKIVDAESFSVPSQAEGAPAMAISVWCQLEKTKRYVDPAKHVWTPKERFRLWLKTAVPVQIFIYQNFPSDRRQSQLVFPQPKHPESYSTILPGESFMLPVLFEMDDDLDEEFISVVFARPDAGLPINHLPTSISAAEVTDELASNNSAGIVYKNALNETKITLASANRGEELGPRKGASSARLTIVPTVVGPAEPASTPESVQTFVFTTAKTQQFQITFHK